MATQPITRHTVLRFAVAQIAVVACLLCLVLSAAQSEEIIFQGLKLSADEITPLSDGTVKVKALGVAKIIKTDELGRYLAILHLKHKADSAQFEIKTVETLTSNSLTDVELALTALDSLLLREDNSDENISTFVANLSQSEAGLSLLRAHVDRAEKDETGASHPLVLFLLARNDASWVRGHALRGLYARRSEFSAIAQSDFEQAIKERKFEDCQRIINSLRGVYGEADPVARMLGYTQSRVVELERIVSSGEVERIAPLLEGARREVEVERVIVPIFMDTLIRLAGENLEQSKPEQAVVILSKIISSKITPHTLDLVVSALSKLDPEKARVVLDAAVFSSLAQFADRDERIKRALLSLLERQVEITAKAGEINIADEALEKIKLLRPDPNKANDDLRAQEAIVLSKRGMHEAARRRITEMSTGLSVRRKLSLMSSGYYGDLKLFIYLLLIPVLIFALIYLRARRLPVEVETINEDVPNEPNETASTNTRSFVAMGRALNPRTQEYVSLLLVLGLEGDADLKQIKTAYRNIVKEVHPDSHSEQGPSSENFIKLTGVYKRILELRKELGLGDED